MTLAQKRRRDAGDQQQEQPRRKEDHPRGKRNQRDGLLNQGSDGIQHRDAVGSLHASALQDVVEKRIFKAGDVERGSVVHDTEADAAAELIGEPAVAVVDGTSDHSGDGGQ